MDFSRRFTRVLFSIPLRRVMLNYPTLRFPEGTAIGNVLKPVRVVPTKCKVWCKWSSGGSNWFVQRVLSCLLKVCRCGWSMVKLYWHYLGVFASIVRRCFYHGLQACVAMLVGLISGWGVGIPLYTHFQGYPKIRAVITTWL